MGPVERALRDRQLILSDPTVQWVRHIPTARNPGTACLVMGPLGWRVSAQFLPRPVQDFLDEFVSDYAGCGSGIYFNDFVAESRQEVLWMLEEAIDEAKAQQL